MFSVSLNGNFLPVLHMGIMNPSLSTVYCLAWNETIVVMEHRLRKRNEGRKEGHVLFNDALITFYLRLYRVGHMVKDHSDSERGNQLPSHGLLFPINNKGSFICTIPQTG